MANFFSSNIKKIESLGHTLVGRISDTVEKVVSLQEAMERIREEMEHHASDDIKKMREEITATIQDLEREQEILWERIASTVGHPVDFVKNYVLMRRPHVLATHDHGGIIAHLEQEIALIGQIRKEVFDQLKKEMEENKKELARVDVHRALASHSRLRSVIDGAHALFDHAKKQEKKRWDIFRNHFDMLWSEDIFLHLHDGHIDQAVIVWKKISPENQTHAYASTIVENLLEEIQEDEHARRMDQIARFYDRISSSR